MVAVPGLALLTFKGFSFMKHLINPDLQIIKASQDFSFKSIYH